MTILPFPTKESPLDAFVKAMKETQFDDVIVILLKGEDAYYLPLTDSDTTTLGWMCVKTAHAIMHQEDEEE